MPLELKNALAPLQARQDSMCILLILHPDQSCKNNFEHEKQQSNKSMTTEAIFL
jgi:hypothetical protein